MLAIPFFHCLDWSSVMLWLLLHHALIFSILTLGEQHKGHLLFHIWGIIKAPMLVSTDALSLMLPFLSQPFQTLAIQVERLDNHFLLLLRGVIFREVFFELVSFDGDIVLLRLLLLHHKLHAVAV